MRKISDFGWIGLVALATGCGLFGSSYDDLQAASERTADVSCECFEEMGYADEDECRADFEDDTTEEEEACLKDAFKEYKDEVDPYVDCAVDAFDAYSDCVEGATDCDATDLLACIDEIAALEDCPEISDSAAEAIAACTD